MKACTGTFRSLPGAFRGSKDAGESEEGMERWGRRGGAWPRDKTEEEEEEEERREVGGEGGVTA